MVVSRTRANSISRSSFGKLDFAPATRLAYKLKQQWAVAIEEYADYGPLHRFHSLRDQSHQMFFVVDRETRFMSAEVGVGVGLTSASDKLTLKLILSRDLN